MKRRKLNKEEPPLSSPSLYLKEENSSRKSPKGLINLLLAKYLKKIFFYLVFTYILRYILENLSLIHALIKFQSYL